MTAAELDASALTPVTGLSAASRINVLLGAGASATVGLPDWDTLVVRLLQRSGVVSGDETARLFLARQDAQLAVEAARLRTDAWEELLRSCLYDPPEGASGQGPAQPGVLHWAVAELAAEREVGDLGLFTLNYDMLLEEALEELEGELSDAGLRERRGVFARGQSKPRAPRDQYEVHHLHGLLEQSPGGRAEGVVLTLSDYGLLDSQERPWQVAALQTALDYGPLVLAGTSYRDPDVRRWLRQLTGEEVGSSVAIVLARESMGLSREQFDQVKDTVVAQWDAIGVQAVLVQDHTDAAQIFRELPAITSAGYRTPQERANTLFRAHLANFHELQLEHATQLNEDLGDLQAHLGADANLTLWLTSGNGQLVRWAANDRVHLGPEHLRHVAGGHDSPWVAGQCLASEAILIREISDAGSTRRWRTVVAVPVAVEAPGGPPFSAAVLSSATSASLDECDPDAWRSAMERLSLEWTARLEDLQHAPEDEDAQVVPQTGSAG